MRRLILLLLLLAAPVHAEVLFEDDFEAQADLLQLPRDNNGTISANKQCSSHAANSPSGIYHAANPGVNDKGVKIIASDLYCGNLPRGWSYMLSDGSDSKPTLRIYSGDANDNLEGLGGTKSLYYHTLTTSGLGSPDDAQLNWHYVSTLDGRKGVPEMWVRYRERVSSAWNMDTVGGGGGSNMMKYGRFGNYLGDGTYRGGTNTGDGFSWQSALNNECYATFSYHNVGKNGGGASDFVFHQMSGRCGNYCYECCFNPSCNTSGGSCTKTGGSPTQRFLWNESKTRYCENASDGITEQYIADGDPDYKTFWDETVMCNDTTGSGNEMEPIPGPSPPCYSFGESFPNLIQGSTAVCNESYNGNSTFAVDKSPGWLNDGAWHTWTFQLKINTSPGTSDGIFRMWIDDQLVHDMTQVRWIVPGWTVSGKCNNNAAPDYVHTDVADGNTADGVGGFNYWGFFGNKASVVGMGSTDNHWRAIDDVVIATTEADLDAHPYYGVSTCDNDGDCSDGLACTGTETCVGAPGGTCSAGTPVTCDDSNACTVDSCVEPGGTCSNVDDDCDDGIACTVDDCNPPTVGCPPSDQRATTCTGNEVCNLTTGACVDPAAPTPIVEGDPWLVFNAQVDDSAVTGGGNTWTSRTHTEVAGAWTNLSTGIGYGACSGSINTTTGSGARNYYMRKHFDVDDASAIGSGTISVAYDDGFKCWINGDEIASANITDDSYGSIATAEHSCGSTNASYEQFAFDAGNIAALVDGDNVLACRAVNFCSAATQSACATEPSMFFSVAADFTLSAADPECSDSVDNDGDGQTDFPNDPGCADANDTSEYGAAECDDGADNDSDTFTDYRVSGGDPGCSALTDTDENGTDVCDNGSDDDGDGFADMLDINCNAPTETTEIGCHDGVVSTGEDCDDGVTITQTCSGLSPSEWASGGSLACDECSFNTDACIPIASVSGLQRSSGVEP